MHIIIILFLYFDDRRDAFLLALLFAVLSIVLSAATLPFGIDAYGLGFLGAGVITAIAGLVLLRVYLNRLEYQVFCRQPLFYEEPEGIFKQLADYVEKQDLRIFTMHQNKKTEKDGTNRKGV